MSRLVPTSILLLGLAVAACSAEQSGEAPAETAKSLPKPAAGSPAPVAPATPAPVAAVAPTAPAGESPVAKPNSLPPIKQVGRIENYRKLSEKIAQGGGPETKADFEALKAEGIVTLISVDGAVPHVDLAKSLGMSYAHVPIGYDGLTADEQARIIKAVDLSTGPVFIHCHHGLHRGPAAAAVARMAVDGIDQAAATLELKDSGCSPNYPGLYRDVAEFKAPSAAVLAALGPLPEAVKPAGVQDSMVHVDEHMDYLKASQAAKWKASPEFPDVAPPHEAMMMVEAFRELQRLDESKKLGADFLAHAKASEDAAVALKAALDAGAPDKAEAAWGAFRKSCDGCHTTYRN